jgi:predicted alpha/beta-hydrolase family hydrolase
MSGHRGKAAGDQLQISVGAGSVSAIWSEAPNAIGLVAIAHGAGNDMRHQFFDGIADGLAAEAVSTLRFNFPYAEAGRRAPDRPAILMDAWRAALEIAEEKGADAPIIASGKSLGGRMASMVAAEDGDGFAGRGLIFFGYPLHAPGRTDHLRDDHLPEVRVPMLFIQGDSDSLARFDLIEGVVKRLKPPARLHRIEGGDHSFRVRGKKRRDFDIGLELAGVAAPFIREVAQR